MRCSRRPARITEAVRFHKRRQADGQGSRSQAQSEAGREGHRPRSRADRAPPGIDRGLFRQVRGEARPRPKRAQGLRLRRGQVRRLHRLLQRADAGAERALQAGARDDRRRRLLDQPLLLLPGGARRGGARAVRRPGARRGARHELPRRAAVGPPSGDARLRRRRRWLPSRTHDEDARPHRGVDQRAETSPDPPVSRIWMRRWGPG